MIKKIILLSSLATASQASLKFFPDKKIRETLLNASGGVGAQKIKHAYQEAHERKKTPWLTHTKVNHIFNCIMKHQETSNLNMAQKIQTIHECLKFLEKKTTT